MHLIMRLFLCLFISIPNAYSFQVEPMVQWLSTHGSSAQATYHLHNPSQLDIPIEITIQSRDVTSEGEEVLTPADDDFIIMPPMASIEKHSSQRVIVRYLGGSELEQAQSYRINFNQLPVDTDSDKSGVKLLINFGSLAFVSPHGSEPILDTQIINDEILISNQGNGVADLSDYSISVSNASEHQKLAWSDIADYLDISFLAPQQSTTVQISDWYTFEAPITALSFVKE